MLTEKQAKKALDAVKKHYAHFIEGCGAEPTLIADYDDHTPWMVMWEEGPDSWAHRACNGGVNTEVMNAAVDEFDINVERAKKLCTETPIVCPKGIAVDVYYSFALTVYEAA